MLKRKQTKKSKTNEKLGEYLRESKKEIQEKEEEFNIEIPRQAEFFKTPIRFGNIPVDKLPMGCDKDEQYRKLYPKISLPFQTVEKISFGHKDLEPNRLIFGDNLHVMRMLPSNSIDLIYIDPPFFSGRNYNVVFGDANEVRSFTDIWEGGMPGYLTWLNARLLEMKRLLKPTGSIFVHVDWHAAHYVKIELDKIFGYDNFRNEIVWYYAQGGKSKKHFARKHDTIFWYSKHKQDYLFDEKAVRLPFTPHKQDKTGKNYGGRMGVDEKGREYVEKWGTGKKKLYRYYLDEGKLPEDVWSDIQSIQSAANERIGYPTQKPEELLKRVILASSKSGDVVADFFVGGGTTPAVAQRLGRRWIACDVSRIAVSVTRDRLLRNILGKNGDKKEIQHSLTKVPSISIEHWGVYEVPQLIKMDEETFKNFVIVAYNGRLSTDKGLIHGYKKSVPIFVGNPSQEKAVTEKEVIDFAKEIVKKKGLHQGTMIAWAFSPGAQNAAQQLAAQHSLAIDFVKVQLVPIESKDFREHVTSKHPEYRELLKFILPPEVRISNKRLNPLEYEFDVSESVSLNPGGRIINVQWDFNYNGERFISTSGYSFIGMKNNKPILRVEYEFNSAGKKKIACKVQDDEGGEKLEIFELNVK